MTDNEDEIRWDVNQEKTKDHWLEVHDPEGWYTAIVRFDGCIHFYRYYNRPLWLRAGDDDDDPPDYLHICDIDEMIARLQALKAVSIAHFGDGWAE